MAQIAYRDIAEFGLRFVTPDDPDFAVLVRDIERRPQPFGSWAIDDLNHAAVLVNESGKAIVVLGYVWRYTMADGTSRTNRHSNLGSSMQLEMLNGRSAVVRDLGTCILAGSKRLITEQGMVGNNLDVLPADEHGHRGSYAGSGGGGGGGRARNNEQITSIQLSLDFAVFENGLCVGPDEYGLFDRLTESLELQRAAAEEAAAALRDGASEGNVFEILLPLARRGRSAFPNREQHDGVLLPMFARMAMDQLISTSAPELLTWFERFAQPPALRLRRPV